MKKAIYFSWVATPDSTGMLKFDDFTVNPDGIQLKSARTASPIAIWNKPGIFDNNSVLQTALCFPIARPSKTNYSFTQFPLYDFSPYYING